MKKEGTEGQRHKGAKRRLFVFGPGIVIALIASAVIVFKNFAPTVKPQSTFDKPSISGIDPLALASFPASYINFTLNSSEKIDLSKEQQDNLKDLLRKYNEEAKPYIASLKKETDMATQYMDDLKNKKISLEEFKILSQSYIRASQELAQVGTPYWKQFEQILTKNQQEMLFAELEKLRKASKGKKYPLKKEATP